MIRETSEFYDPRKFKKKTRWILNRRDDEDYYLILKGTEYVWACPRKQKLDVDIPRTIADLSINEYFRFLDLSSQLQLKVLLYLSGHEVCCCRLVCRSLNCLIMEHYSQLAPPKIGTVDVYLKESQPLTCVPALDDAQLESKKLDEFHDATITALQFVEGELSSEALNSLLSAFIRCHVTVLTLSCLNCHLSCTVDEFINFLKCCNVKTLTINAVNMRPFVHEFLQYDVVHNLSCMLLYSVPYVNNAPIVLSSMFRDGSPSLKDFRILLKEWKDGFFDILRFHVQGRADWPDRDKVISGLKFRVSGRDREAGNFVLWNTGGRRLRFRVGGGFYFLSPS
ncbi:hypothetical protein Aduo_016761 [Ancylostoma duodenale]